MLPNFSKCSAEVPTVCHCVLFGELKSPTKDIKTKTLEIQMHEGPFPLREN